MLGGKYPQNNSRPPDKKTYASATATINKEVLRSYHEEVSMAKKNRNKIEIRFVKENKDEASRNKQKYVDLDTVSEYVFSELKIKPEDILEIDLNTGRNDIKEITFKPDVDTEKMIEDFPDTYNGFIVNISRVSQKTT